MKVKIKNLPKGFALENGKVYRDGGGTTGDQSNYGLVGVPHMDNTNGSDSPFSSINMNFMKWVLNQKKDFHQLKYQKIIN